MNFATELLEEAKARLAQRLNTAEAEGLSVQELAEKGWDLLPEEAQADVTATLTYMGHVAQKLVLGELTPEEARREVALSKSTLDDWAYVGADMAREAALAGVGKVFRRVGSGLLSVAMTLGV